MHLKPSGNGQDHLVWVPYPPGVWVFRGYWCVFGIRDWMEMILERLRRLEWEEFSDF